MGKSIAPCVGVVEDVDHIMFRCVVSLREL
jgi:hypothetical protein